MNKTYVEFMYPGTLFSESSTKEVSSRDLAAIKIPKGCFGYKFFDQAQTEVDGEILTGEAKNYSGMFYSPGAQVMALDDVKREVPDCSTLVSNMKSNGYEKVVRTNRGNFQPFFIEDVVLE